MKQNLINSAMWKKFFLFAYFQTIMLSAVITMPPTISYDGFNYISSGVSLFSNEFPTYYQLMREPGYPLIIKLSSFTGDLLLTINLIQSFLLGFAGYLLFLIARINLKLRLHVSLIGTTLGLLMVRGYATAVLQQALICLVSIAIIYSILNKPTKFSKSIWFCMGSIAYLTNTVLAIVYLLVLTYLFIREKGQRNSVFKEILIPGVFGVSISVLIWLGVVFNVSTDSQLIPSPRTPFGLNYVGDVSLSEKFTSRVESLGALIFIGREHVHGVDSNKLSLAGEASLYGSATNYDTWENCIRWMGGQKEIELHVEKYLNPRCVSLELRKLQSLLSKLLFPLFPIAGYSLLIVLGQSRWRRNRELEYFLLVPILFTIVLAAGGAGVSRYSVVLAAISPLLIIMAVNEFRKNRV